MLQVRLSDVRKDHRMVTTVDRSEKMSVALPGGAELIGRIPLFAQLEPGEQDALHRLLRTREYPANDTIFWIGEPGDEFFIVQAGRVIISYIDEQGAEVTLATLDHGQFFGELSLLDGGRRT